MPWHEVVTGFDVFAIVLGIGITIAALWLTPPAAAIVVRTEIRRRLRGVFGGVLGLLTLTSIAVLVARSMAISGAGLTEMGKVLPLVLTQTDFGRVWIARGAAVLLLWLLWWLWHLRDAKSTWEPWLLFALIAVVAFTRSATGHAGDHGDFGIPVWIDWLHLVAAGLWGGVIAAFLLAARPVLAQSENYGLRPVTAQRFSSLAAAGLCLAVATGVYNAWHELGGWRPLWTTYYGLVLDIKLALVIAMALLGASNRFRHVPGIIDTARTTVANAMPRAFQLLLATATAEAALWLAILAVVALLLHAMPPAALVR